MTIDQSLKRDLLKSNSAGPAAPDGRGTAELPASAELDQRLGAACSSKQVLLRSIEFRPAQQGVSGQLQGLRGKYVALNPGQAETEDAKAMQNNKHGQMNGTVEVRQDDIPAPKKVLYPADKIVLAWQRCQRVGPGLINMGNTCFLNATLQCLTYTPPLTNYLLSHQHKSECRELGFCIMCELCNHVHRTFNHQQNGQAIRPMVILHKLKHFAKHMHIGRQEDAHEFLRLLIEAMQKVCIHGQDKLDKYSKETSLVYQIFSGYYRSRVTCSVCQNKSDTFDPFLDIGLDIKQAPSVTKALERLIRPEMLEGENQYQCKKCNRKVQAQKRFTIQRAPAVLTLCLKRFDFNRFSMGKINKEIVYSDHLNLRPYMSEPKGPAILYDLYAVLKHEGASCNSGHYYCFVKAANQSWYCMNDAFVSQVSQQRALNQNAYLLFYIRRNSFKSPMNGGGEPKRDVLQTKNAKPAATTSNAQTLFNGPVGVPVPRPSTSSTQGLLHQQNAGFKPTLIKEDKPKHSASSVKQKQQQEQQQAAAARQHLPSMVQREKISFQFQHKGPGLAAPSPAKSPLVVAGKQPPVVSGPALTKPKPTASVAGTGDAPARPAKAETTPAGSGGGGGTFSPLRPSHQPMTSVRESPKQVPERAAKGRPSPNGPSVNGLSSNKLSQSGLVPYTAEDSNSSSSDSDTNYDQVAAELSAAPAGDGPATPPTPRTAPEAARPKTDTAQQREAASATTTTPLLSKIRENHANLTPMKPPAAAAKSAAPADTALPQLSPTHVKRAVAVTAAGLANSVNLTSIRKPDSPLKLTITTSGGPAQRIKSTSHWRAVEADPQISPSPASDCSLHSNVSTNSTSEWNILEKRDAPQTPEAVKKEAAVFGWSVTPAGKGAERAGPDPEEPRTKPAGPKLALTFDGDLGRAREGTNPDRRPPLDQAAASQPELTPTSGEETQQEGRSQKAREDLNSAGKAQQDQGAGDSDKGSPDRDSAEEPNGERTPKRKKKKHKKISSLLDTSLLGPADQSDLSLERCKQSESSSAALSPESLPKTGETDAEAETAPKHKKHKKKKKRKERLKEEEEEEWVERVIEPSQYDEQERLLAKQTHNHNKHSDKHKSGRHSRGAEDSDEDTDCDHDRDASSPTKKKKKKKKKRREDGHSLIRRRHEKKLKKRRREHEHRDVSPESEERRSSSHDGHHAHKQKSHKASREEREEKRRKRHSSDDLSSSDHLGKARLADDGQPEVEEEGKWKRTHHSDSDRHRHGSDTAASPVAGKDSRPQKDRKKPSHGDSDRESRHSDLPRQLNGDGDASNHIREVKKKKKKKKKKWRKHAEGEEEEEEEEDNDERPLLVSADAEDGYRLKKKKKKKRYSRLSDAEEDSMREEEIPSKKAKYQVATQQWDHHIRDGHGRQGDDTKPAKTHTSWDGACSSSSGAVEELSKASLKAYGPAIKSWDGGCSALDNEVEEDVRQERQRDQYEEDFDRGKVKKVKKLLESGRQQLFGGHHNPFQSLQNTRNKDHHGYSRFSNQSHGECPR